MKRLVILPDEKLEAVAAGLQLRLASIVREISAENLPDLIDPVSAEILAAVGKPLQVAPMLWACSGSHYSLVWMPDSPQELVLRATADLQDGLVAMVFKSERSAFAREPDLNVDRWTNLSRLKSQSLEAMAGVPVRLAGRVVGVLTLSGSSVDEGQVGPLSLAAEVFAKLAEARMLRDCLGLENR